MKINLEELKVNNFPSEEHFQAFCIKMISQEFPLLRGKVWHTQNEQHIELKEGESTSKKDGKMYDRYIERCQRIGNMNKAKGKVAGIMDILFMLNGILYKIELKQPSGTLTDSQKLLHPIWNKDCPQLPILIAFTPYPVYKYCDWVCKMNLKIKFPDNYIVYYPFD